jgi:hypothetical protein
MRGFAKRPFGKGARFMISSWRGFGWPWVAGAEAVGADGGKPDVVDKPG